MPGRSSPDDLLQVGLYQPLRPYSLAETGLAQIALPDVEGHMGSKLGARCSKCGPVSPPESFVVQVTRS
jgi:hypothetical protein